MMRPDLDRFIAGCTYDECAEHPSLRCRRFRKPTFSRPMPAALAAEVAEHCTCVVAALAD